MLVILEYSLDDITAENISDTVLTDILKSIPIEELRSINNKAELMQLKRKFGDEAFLSPHNLKYPIINPKTGKRDQALIHAAYIDLKRNSGITGTGDLAQKAKDMLSEQTFVVEINQEHIPLIDWYDMFIN